jgi:hypothetical protein
MVDTTAKYADKTIAIVNATRFDWN